MVAVKLLKEPGYIYDLNFIFYLKFNYSTYFDSLPEDQRTEANMEFFKSTMKSFGEIPDDLYVFCHAVEAGFTFLSASCIWAYNNLFTSEFSFRFFMNQFRDKNNIVRKLIKFYFDNLSSEEIDECMESNAKLFACIKDSSYTHEEKSKLYEFFIDPDSYIQCLVDQLAEKEQMLSLYYEKNYQKIFDVFNQTTFHSISQQVEGLKDLSFLEQNDQVLYTSYCLLHKYYLNLHQVEDGAIYLLGVDYRLILEFAKEKRREPRLDTFGSALAEENRARILQHILENEDSTCKDLEKVFNFSGSTVYHHVSILLKAGLLKTRNEGKTIFYSVNRPYFDTVINALKKYSTKR